MGLGWKAPFPFKVGGKATQLVGDIYQSVKAGTGSMLLGPPGSETDLENKVLARMVACGYRAARRRANGGDPKKLFDGARIVKFDDGTSATLSPIDRWEGILGITSSPNSTAKKRRGNISRARSPVGASDRGTIRTLLDAIFTPWIWSMQHADDVSISAGTAYWQGATGAPAYPGAAPTGTSTWYSDIFSLFVGVQSPAGTTADEIMKRQTRGAALLEEILPAHCDFYLTVF